MCSLHFRGVFAFSASILMFPSYKPLTLSPQNLGGSFVQLFQLWFHKKSAFEGLIVVFYSGKKKAKLHIHIYWNIFYNPYFYISYTPVSLTPHYLELKRFSLNPGWHLILVPDLKIIEFNCKNLFPQFKFSYLGTDQYIYIFFFFGGGGIVRRTCSIIPYGSPSMTFFQHSDNQEHFVKIVHNSYPTEKHVSKLSLRSCESLQLQVQCTKLKVSVYPIIDHY